MNQVVINNLQDHGGNGIFISLAEVKLFFKSVQLSTSSLTFRFSGTLAVDYSADKCNNGILTDMCHSQGSNPTLTILSSAVFDTVKVYNNVVSHFNRIEGATITTTTNGNSSSTVFPEYEDALYTFIIMPSTGELQQLSEPNRVVINNLQNTHQACGSGLFINLAEVQLFYKNVQLPTSSLTFRFSTTLIYNGVSYPADKCNNGILTDYCHTNFGDNPTLTILSSAVFDMVKVYNRVDSCLDRIKGATITSTINGLSSVSTFPQSAQAVYTFSVQLPTAQTTQLPTFSLIPTATPSSTVPTFAVTQFPTATPSSSPTFIPSMVPSFSLTTLPSSAPTIIPYKALFTKESPLFYDDNFHAFSSLPQALNVTFSISVWITASSYPASIVSLGRSAASSSNKAAGEFVLEINKKGNLYFWDYSPTTGVVFSVSGGKVLNDAGDNKQI